MSKISQYTYAFALKLNSWQKRVNMLLQNKGATYNGATIHISLHMDGTIKNDLTKLQIA